MANEKRLIDANALKDRFKLRLDWLKLDVHDEYTKGLYHGCDYDMTLIDEQTTVDAVEVVRCKDCRWARKKDHREPTDTPRELICQCFMHHYIPAPWGARMAVNPEDFCSYGERKDNG